jgi:hypothetical protein
MVTKTQAVMGALVGGLAGGLTGSGDTQGSQGYTGGIPDLTAGRELVPDAFGQTYTTPTGALAPRRPGSVGRRYFTDVNYTPVTDETGAPTIMGGAEIAAMNQAALNRQQELTQLGQDLIGLYGQNNAAIDDTTGLYGQDTATTDATTGTTLTTPDAFTTFITPFIGRTPTAEDAITLANSGYSVEQIASALNYTPESLQTFLDYYTTGAGDTVIDDTVVGGGDDTVVGAGGDDTVVSGDDVAAEKAKFDAFISTLPAPENLTIYDVQPILESGYSTVEIAKALNIPESVLGELFREWSGSELAVFPAAGTTTTEDTVASLITGAGDEGTDLTSLITTDTTDTTPTTLNTTEMKTLLTSTLGFIENADGSLTDPSEGTVYSIQDGAWKPTTTDTTTTQTTPTETTETTETTSLNTTEMKNLLTGTYGFIENADGSLTDPSAGTVYSIQDGAWKPTTTDTTTTQTTPTETTPTNTTDTTGTTTTETTTPTDLETFAQTFSFSGDSVTAEEAKTLLGTGFTVAELADALDVTEKSLQENLDYHTSGQYEFDTFIDPFRGRELGQADAVALANSGYTPEQIASALKVDINDLNDFLAFADTTPTDTTTTDTTTTETTKLTPVQEFAQTFSFSGDSVTAEEAKTLLGTGFTVAELADALDVTEKSLQENLDYHTSGQYEFDTFIDPFRGRELGQADAVALANSGYTPEQIASALKVDINDLNDFLAFADTTPTDTTTTDTTTTETTKLTPVQEFAQTFSFSGDSVTADEAETLINTGFTVAELADALDVTEESLQENLDYHTSGQYGLSNFVAGLPDKLDVNAGKAKAEATT